MEMLKARFFNGRQCEFRFAGAGRRTDPKPVAAPEPDSGTQSNGGDGDGGDKDGDEK